jgi:hypothetical protein
MSPILDKIFEAKKMSQKFCLKALRLNTSASSLPFFFLDKEETKNQG